MAKSTTSIPFRATKPQVVTAKKRQVKQAATTPFDLDPDYQKQIYAYTAKLNEKVIGRFIDDPVLLASVYELLGMLPSEIEDIQKRCRDGHARMALFEVDDLIEKLTLWRIKLSHKMTL